VIRLGPDPPVLAERHAELVQHFDLRLLRVDERLRQVLVRAEQRGQIHDRRFLLVLVEQRLVVAFDGRRAGAQLRAHLGLHLHEVIDLRRGQLARRGGRKRRRVPDALLDVGHLSQLGELGDGALHLHVPVVPDADDGDADDQEHDPASDSQLLHE
jgi:hypothetical protein